jgi:hypothetical protein
MVMWSSTEWPPGTCTAGASAIQRAATAAEATEAAPRLSPPAPLPATPPPRRHSWPTRAPRRHGATESSSRVRTTPWQPPGSPRPPPTALGRETARRRATRRMSSSSRRAQAAPRWAAVDGGTSRVSGMWAEAMPCSRARPPSHCCSMAWGTPPPAAVEPAPAAPPRLQGAAGEGPSPERVCALNLASSLATGSLSPRQDAPEVPPVPGRTRGGTLMADDMAAAMERSRQLAAMRDELVQSYPHGVPVGGAGVGAAIAQRGWAGVQQPLAHRASAPAIACRGAPRRVNAMQGSMLPTPRPLHCMTRLHPAIAPTATILAAAPDRPGAPLPGHGAARRWLRLRHLLQRARRRILPSLTCAPGRPRFRGRARRAPLRSRRHGGVPIACRRF